MRFEDLKNIGVHSALDSIVHTEIIEHGLQCDVMARMHCGQQMMHSLAVESDRHEIPKRRRNAVIDGGSDLMLNPRLGLNFIDGAKGVALNVRHLRKKGKRAFRGRCAGR